MTGRGHIAGESLRSVLPVFLTLSLALACLIYWLSQKEIRWGLMEEASAYSVSIAEFIDHNALLALSRNELTKSEEEQVFAPLKRIMRIKRISRLWACLPGMARPVFALGPHGRVLTDTRDIQCPSEPQSPAVQMRTSHSETAISLESHSLITDTHGRPYGSIGVSLDAGELALQRQADLVQGGWGLTTALAAGMICSGIITLFLNRRLSLLTNMAMMAGDGEYALKNESMFGRVKEICSLGSTFNTVMGVLQGHLRKSQRKMMEIELSQDRVELAYYFEESTATTHSLVHADTLLIVRRLDNQRCNLVVELFVHQNSAFAILARLASPARNMETVLSTSALRRMFIQSLPERGLAGSLDLARQLFPLHDCLLVCLENNGKELLMLKLQEQNYQESIEHVPLPADQPLLIHNLGSKLQNHFVMLTEAFPDASPEALLTAIQRFAADHQTEMMGAVLLARKLEPEQISERMKPSPSDNEV